MVCLTGSVFFNTHKAYVLIVFTLADWELHKLILYSLLLIILENFKAARLHSSRATLLTWINKTCSPVRRDSVTVFVFWVLVQINYCHNLDRGLCFITVRSRKKICVDPCCTFCAAYGPLLLKHYRLKHCFFSSEISGFVAFVYFQTSDDKTSRIHS